MEIAVLEFTRKIVRESHNLDDTDFKLLRDQGLANGDIVRIIAISAWALGETVVSRAIEAQPEMPAFARAVQR